MELLCAFGRESAFADRFEIKYIKAHQECFQDSRGGHQAPLFADIGMCLHEQEKVFIAPDDYYSLCK